MRIKKISPTTPANGNIENQYGTSQTNAYSEEYVNGQIGNLSNLTTTAKSNVVSAINELDSLKATKDVATTSANGLMSSTDKTLLDNETTYSTTETRVGTWIDGKFLYRKVLNTTSITTNSQQSLGTINNVAKVISIKGVLINRGGFTVPLGEIWGTDINTRNNYLWADVGSTTATIKYQIGSAYTQASELIAIVEYTKTTS
jgi:hypothetical protein